MHSDATKVFQYLMIKMTITGLGYGWFYILDLVIYVHNNDIFLITKENSNLHFLSKLVR